MRIIFQHLLAILLVTQLSACTVKPWERGNLAKKNMAITPNPSLNALRDHAFISKEASQGGYGGSGGGCGCN